MRNLALMWVLAACLLGCGGKPPVSTFTDTRDGKVYKIVEIGSQTWFAENLNYAAKGSVCYENSADSCDKYGRLYSWKTALTACPYGTHLPADDEWKTLLDYVSGDSTAGTKLRSSTGWQRIGDVAESTDEYGFSALPGGGYKYGTFRNAGAHSHWWSATALVAEYAYSWNVYCDYKFLGRGIDDTAYLLSVRCVQDKGAKDKPAPVAVAPDTVAFAPGTVTDTVAYTYAAFIDRRDGKVYKTIKIGKQLWMSENLNYAAEGSVCYENSADSCAKYGRLYDWETANKACPAGFHLAHEIEWRELAFYPKVGSIVGTVLKSASGWIYNGNGTDEYGFSALPGGYAFPDSYGGFNFVFVGREGLWWSATESDANFAVCRRMDWHLIDVYSPSCEKTTLLSVRCVKN
jgi:uncharacterized protein (TIGR02145 family)